LCYFRAPLPIQFTSLALHDALPILVRDQGVGGSNPLAPISPNTYSPFRNASGTGCRRFCRCNFLSDFFPLIHFNSAVANFRRWRSEEHTSELQSRFDLVCRLLLEKK